MKPDANCQLISISIDGQPVTVAPGTTVAAALMNAGIASFRRSLGGEPRGPLCGMGICYECCVTINDEEFQRSCQVLCRDGQRIVTHG